MGRWLERDPIGFAGGMNAYAYCAGQPVGRMDPTGKIVPLLVMIGAGGLVSGCIGAYMDDENPLRGFGRGFVIGAVGTAAALATGGAASAGLGALGVEGVGGGMIAGAASGAAASVAGQGVGMGMGWQDEFSWGSVGLGTATGALFGGGVFRPVRANGSVNVSHWGRPSPWVQAGKPNLWNRLLAGYPSGEGCTCTVDAKSLTSPTGWELGKGLFGQRILK